MRYLILVVAGFCLLCGALVIESGLFDNPPVTERGCILLQNVAADQQTETPNLPVSNNEQLKPVAPAVFGADNAPAETITLGSVDPNTGYRFQLQLSTKGAAIRKATFSEYKDRNYKNPQPLVIISPVREFDGSEVMAMANTNFILVEQQLQLPLNRLDWKSFGIETSADGLQTARFEAIIKRKETGRPALKLTKIYKIRRDSYLIDCDITIENFENTEQKVRMNMYGPGGLDREAFRTDLRKIVGAFRDSRGQISTVKLDMKHLSKAENLSERELTKPGGEFLWIAAVNKYFAAILVPTPQDDKEYCDWIARKSGRFYNPHGDIVADGSGETLGSDLQTTTDTLAAAGQAASSRAYDFQLYVGPKDNSLFDKNEMYRKLGFVQTIDFRGCCCPAQIINPLAFGILAIMKWMHGFIPNYGVVIIILVFLMRLVMHPITKKSQVSMSKMSKLAPKAEEIKKKYANNKAEMNKQMMALYREQGASPIMGFLPMLVQMPIWIALWSAVYTSIDLRGAAFLPFWITDLSVPDALIRFPVVTVPLLGWKIQSLNLLPILMGVAFYLQQQLMPSQASASANPQMAQQQKMMKIMMPLLFPLMLYTAPSGVNLYIMASTFAGVIEQYVIRKHIREKDEAESKGLVSATSKTGGKVKKKKPKPFYKT
jgi:YidC/Oxa1 family membrane protein insertase